MKYHLNNSMEEEGSRREGDPCPICLQPIDEESFLDRCFHRFCYPCLSRWVQVVAKKHQNPLSSITCPLCKSENFSIIYDIIGSGFKQQHVGRNPLNSFLSKAHLFRWHCYHENPAGRPLHHKFNIPLYWKRGHYLKKNLWIESWLRRDMQALTQEKDVEVIVHHVLGVIESFLESCRKRRDRSSGSSEDKRGEFRALVSDAARPFLPGQMEHFVDELEFFMVSGLNIEAYDKMYMQYINEANMSSTIYCGSETNNESGTLPFLDDDFDDNG